MGDKNHEDKIKTLITVVEHIAKKQCDDDKLPHNVLVSVFLNAAQDAFEETIEHIINKERNPLQARVFLHVQMKILQMWAQQAERVDKNIEAMIKETT